VATAKVPVGGGVILGGPRIVVTQPAKGTFKAFTAVCTHQACTVGMVKDNVISCPCHGSAYSATDGSVKNGPATRALRAIPITVDGGQVVES
jgi:Rieske Fe-S protein